MIGVIAHYWQKTNYAPVKPEAVPLERMTTASNTVGSCIVWKTKFQKLTKWESPSSIWHYYSASRWWNSLYLCTLKTSMPHPNLFVPFTRKWTHRGKASNIYGKIPLLVCIADDMSLSWLLAWLTGRYLEYEVQYINSLKELKIGYKKMTPNNFTWPKRSSWRYRPSGLSKEP